MIKIKFDYYGNIINGILLGVYERQHEETYTIEKKFFGKIKTIYKTRKLTSPLYIIFIPWKHKEKELVEVDEKYILNLIDTPGHVDFSYEVSRSIAACEGALLVVDASQGVQAQTISNLYMALENDLEIIPVMNKCDMDSAMPEEVEDEIVDLLGCKREEIIRASGKTGLGVEEILNAVVERIPHPEGDEEAPLQALRSVPAYRIQIYDSSRLTSRCEEYRQGLASVCLPR